MRALLASVIVGFGIGFPQVAAAASLAQLRAERSEWVLEVGDGAQWRSADLVGAELRLEGGAVLRIDGVRRIEDSGRSWWAHELSVRVPGEGWRPLCDAYRDGTRYAVILPGREAPDGLLTDERGAFAISCTSGALAKCLRMGYEPWRVVPGGSSMRPTFNACVRMVRADYAGIGRAYTENGRLIDVYDPSDIQSPDNSPEHTFEAGWDEHGAVCVHHARVAGKVSLETLEEAAPRLRGNVGTICTEAHARSLGALIFNRSAVLSSAD